MHKLHHLVGNPTIPPKYAFEVGWVDDVVSEEFEKWLVQDQTLFTWLLSNLSETALLHVLTCHHSWQVWQKIQQHYFSNAAYTHDNTHTQGVRGNASQNFHARGRGRQGCGLGRADGTPSQGPRPTCQLCACYGHSILDCWYRFDEMFIPPALVVQATNNNAPESYSQNNVDAPDSASPTINLVEALPLDATCNDSELSSPSSDPYEDWYGGTGASHNVTPNKSNLQHHKPYKGN